MGMKKIYNSPTIETAELHMASIVCAGSPDKGIDDGGGGSMFAPKRKPFELIP